MSSPAGRCWLLLGVVLAIGVAARPTQAARNRHYDFVIKETNVTRLCSNKTILTVNGQFPGPTIYARKGDTVIVNVHNHGNKNITLHWHGVDQPRNPWFDGPEYITQCPIQAGNSFTYKIFFTEEEGTLWWHAHSDYDRLTVHGAIVIHPKKGTVYPYPKPDKEVPIILGEWWKEDTDKMYAMIIQGNDTSVADANTINGQPGDFFNCSKNDTFKMSVEHGKTYLLRVINAQLTNLLFFAIAGHSLTVVGTDGRYLKPFTVDHMFITPGQTMNVLLKANRSRNGSANTRYYMAARAFATTTTGQFTRTNTTAILEYTDVQASTGPPDSPVLPAYNDNDTATSYTGKLKSLVTKEHPIDVPMKVDEDMLVTITVNALPCPANKSCSGIGGNRMASSMTNLSFTTQHSTNILDAYYTSTSGVYETDFPNMPSTVFNFTDPDLNSSYWFTKQATKLKVLEYGTVMEVVFQDATIISVESHPIHLHGFSFYVVGMGFGNFDKDKDRANYNLVDPPYQNTVSVPTSGWAAIRFRATNPGVWFMHCHVERHMVWGMDTVFIVKNGKTPEAQMMPRPPNMPKC